MKDQLYVLVSCVAGSQYILRGNRNPGCVTMQLLLYILIIYYYIYYYYYIFFIIQLFIE